MDLEPRLEQERARLVVQLRSLAAQLRVAADALEEHPRDAGSETALVLSAPLTEIADIVWRMYASQRAPLGYVAVLRQEPGGDYSVSFPDLPGCVTAGRTRDEARSFATEALTRHLDGLAAEHVPIPAPRSLDAVRDAGVGRDATLILVAPTLDQPPPAR